MGKLFKKDNSEEHNSWMSYTDLLSGFLIVFIVASLIYFNQLSDVQKKLQGYSPEAINNMIKWQETHGNLVNINNDFKDVFEGIDSVVFLKEEGSIRLYPTNENKHDSILFETGKAKIQPNLEKRLAVFGPRFIRKAMHLVQEGKNIAEIRIEGHTDSDGQFFGGLDSQGDYSSDEGNLLLSSRRAYVIYRYLYENCCRTSEERNFVLQHVISVGYSSQKTIKDTNGREDKDKSRRIEFRIISK